MYDHIFLNLQITGTDIRPHIKWAVHLVIVCGHFNLPQGLCGYVWVHWVANLIHADNTLVGPVIKD